MTHTYAKKAEFVRGALSECMRAADEEVQALSYTVHIDGTETVTVHFKSGYDRKVDVTGDSHLAIIHDVIIHGHL